MHSNLLRYVAILPAFAAFACLQSQSPVERPAYVCESLQSSQQSSSDHLINSPTHLDARGTRLVDLISKAYDTPAALILGLDPKLADSRFDILASYQPKPGEFVKSHELLRNMLAEQFHISAHRENRTVAVYAMTVAPSGIRFSTSVVHNGSINSDDHSFAGHGVSMGFVATDLSDTMRSIVVDRTALSGHYDLNLTWQNSRNSAAITSAIQQAAEQQLGLRLEPTQATVEALLIDHVELAHR